MSLAAIAQEFSPRYERHRDDLVTIDVSGLERLLGPPRAIGEELRREAASRNVRVHVAVAGTRMAALILAHARPGVTVIAPGEEADALAPIAIGILERVTDQRRSVLDTREGYSPSASAAGVGPRGSEESSPREGKKVDEAIESAFSTFKAWGLKALGELAALPSADLASRLGRQALVWQAMARGEEVRPLIPTLEEERFESSLELEWPIEGLEPLSFVLTRLLEPLSTRLERRDRGAAVLHVLLRLVTKDTYARRLELPSPMRDVRALRTLVLLDLESHPPAAAIDRVSVVIDPTPGRVLQHTLFTRAHPTPEQLSTLVARLGALMGHDRLGAPASVDSYRPGAFAMVPFATEHDHNRNLRRSVLVKNVGRDASHQPDPTNTIVSALRRCRHPVPARVTVDNGRPVRVTTDRRGFVGGTIVACAGPWRTSGEWWATSTAASEAPSPQAACAPKVPAASEGDARAVYAVSASGAGAAQPRWGAEGPHADTRGRADVQPLDPARPVQVTRERFTPRSASGVGVGPHAFNKDEWDVALNDGAVYRIFQDRTTAAWFIDAIVD